jgi:hypothetical protein
MTHLEWSCRIAALALFAVVVFSPSIGGFAIRGAVSTPLYWAGILDAGPIEWFATRFHW